MSNYNYELETLIGCYARRLDTDSDLFQILSVTDDGKYICRHKDGEVECLSPDNIYPVTGIGYAIPQSVVFHELVNVIYIGCRFKMKGQQYRITRISDDAQQYICEDSMGRRKMFSPTDFGLEVAR